ncbi:ependymin-2-like isoform X1 [Cheilinus undulatus]|uniref:ependymin-2-like isoform X1 n=1 Tax=Cheilinus undulatus TaxID=241271 RepID=UPI001BD453D0|nr:ependymin-2-like isoform X1 [Cheilinus undulatus]
MRVFVALACLLANCLAQKPQPCDWPPKMTGEATMDFTNDDTGVDIRFVYDAVGQRMRFFQNATRDNETINTDSLLLFKEEVAYNINDQNRTCTKFPLKVDFIPLGVPKNASLLGQVILGSSSGPGEGLMVNTWSVNLPDGGDIISTVTAVGCIPVSLVQKVKIDEQVMGWMVQSFFNNVIGIPDPSLLSPPSFCKDAKVMSNKEPVDFFSLFLHKK